MDATATSVVRLHEQNLSQNIIAKRLSISQQKVRRILITTGHVITDESRLYAAGLTIDEIAQRLGKSRNAVIGRLPYSKGQYMAEYPTINALKIRQCRANKEVDNDV